MEPAHVNARAPAVLTGSTFFEPVGRGDGGDVACAGHGVEARACIAHRPAQRSGGVGFLCGRVRQRLEGATIRGTCICECLTIALAGSHRLRGFSLS